MLGDSMVRNVHGLLEEASRATNVVLHGDLVMREGATLTHFVYASAPSDLWDNELRPT